MTIAWDHVTDVWLELLPLAGMKTSDDFTGPGALRSPPPLVHFPESEMQTY